MNFKLKTSSIDEAYGYATAFTQILQYLNEVTDASPSKRFIDAAELADKISKNSIEIDMIKENKTSIVKFN